MARIQARGYRGVSRRGTVAYVGQDPFVAIRDTSTAPPGDDWRPPIVKSSEWDELGPPGKDGVDGRDGRDGKDAPPARGGRDGKGLNWRGEWKRRRQYEPNDVVEHEGSTFVAQESTRSEPGTRNSGWQLMAARGEQGERGEAGFSGGRGRPGENAQTIVIENGNPPSIAVFDSNTARGDVLYVAETGHVDLAQANGEPQAIAVGLALASVAAGMAGTYQTTGPVSNPAWNLTPGAVYYLSPSVAGGMTDTFPNSPGDYVCILGAALSETEFNLNIHWALVIGS